MPHGTKIATCCYCSSKTVLKLTARNGHELACGSCGAPLHEMKWLRVNPQPSVKRARPSADTRTAFAQERSRKPLKKKKKPLWKRALAEVFDVVEDIFD
jgi:hypothetical protein